MRLRDADKLTGVAVLIATLGFITMYPLPAFVLAVLAAAFIERADRRGSK